MINDLKVQLTNLSPKPGDIIVAKVDIKDYQPIPEDLENLVECLKSVVPEGCEILVHTLEAEIEVINTAR